MNRGYPKTKMWGRLGLVCVMSGCHLAGAQTRPAAVEPRWLRLKLTEGRVGFELESEMELREIEHSPQSISRDRLELSPFLGLDFEGSVYHPNLLQYQAKLENGLGWLDETIQAGAGAADHREEFSWLQRYYGEITLLQRKPYATSFLASKVRTYRDLDFFNTVTVDNQSYEGRSGYRAGWLPFHVSARRQEEVTTGFTVPSDEVTDTLSVTARHEHGQGNTTDLEYTAETFRREEPNFPTQEGTSHTASALDTESFGADDRFRLTSNLFYNRLDSTSFSTRGLSAQERFTIQHRPSLYSAYNYHFDTRVSGPVNNDSHQANASLHHQWYESLNSTLDVHGRTDSSRAADSFQGIDQYGVGLNERYSKRLGDWGRLNLGYQFRYDQEHRKTLGQFLFIAGETHTLSITNIAPVYLDQPRVIASSVVVRSPAGFEYQLGLDYDLRTRGLLTELILLPASRIITGGGDVVVDYLIATQPSDAFTTFANLLQVRLELFQGLFGLYGRLNLVDNVGGESLVLQNISGKVVGMDVNWRWLKAGAEHEIFDSNLNPSQSTRLYQTLQFTPTAASTLTLDFGQDWTTFPDTQLEQSIYYFIGRTRLRLTPHLEYHVEGGLRIARGRGIDQDLATARTGLDFALGQLSVKLGYEFQDNHYLAEQRVKHFFFLRAWRKF